jgi:hypothetical protein
LPGEWQLRAGKNCRVALVAVAVHARFVLLSNVHAC